MGSGYRGGDAAPRKSFRSVYAFWRLWRVGKKPNISDLSIPNIQWPNTQFLGLTSTAGELRGEERTTTLLPSALKRRRDHGDRSQALDSFQIQLTSCDGREEARKSSGLARAALIGSMLII